MNRREFVAALTAGVAMSSAVAAASPKRHYFSREYDTCMVCGVSAELIEDGLAPDVPVAVIENASRPAMRVLRGPLAGLATLVSEQRVASPAVIVIGEVAAHSDTQIGVLALEAMP